MMGWRIEEKVYVFAGLGVMAIGVSLVAAPFFSTTAKVWEGVLFGAIGTAVTVAGLIITALGFELKDPLNGTHCQDCGKALSPTKIPDGFSSRTGLPQYLTRWVCPGDSYRPRCYGGSPYGGSPKATTSSALSALYATYAGPLQQAHLTCPNHLTPKLNCEVCRQSLVQAGVLSAEEAANLR